MTEEELQQQQEGQAQDQERTFTQADINEAVTQAMAKRDEAERIQQERAQATARLDNAFAEANSVKENKKLHNDAITRLNDAGLSDNLASMVQSKDTRIMNDRISIILSLIQTETSKAIKKSLAGNTPKQSTGAIVNGTDKVASAFGKGMTNL